ncbi:MAG: hypothetical protein LBF93_02225 [Zoogloeaceae bacterium]|jgi:hypothetical protein|nr:hypothetical protein [Zoogloeaceae bacterium]
MSSAAIIPFDPSIHRDHMPEVSGPNPARQVLIVTSGKFQLEFLSLAQIDAAIRYFRSPSGSTRQPADSGDHWEFQSWQGRLPAGINNSRNRARMLSALVAARRLAREQLS